MRTSWEDSVASAEAENVGSASSDNHGVGSTARPTKSTYIPPHLRNRHQSSEPAAPSFSGPPSSNDRLGFGGSASGSRIGGSRQDHGRGGGYGGGGRSGGWNNGIALFYLLENIFSREPI
ncbi:hypothetical protein Nepgr_026765 [Nepenthes gracilis]|uniref:Uncharacterized protein n=1 Tax=Nepenthes gracilis TaxID=150966 RepID=A0AAD3T8S8_NEPGR|nr:hypothetical protein Nepgr_026765 [Nepenthes gracilis]